MKIDAEIICKRTPLGAICEWKGGKVAEVSGELFEEAPKAGSVLTVGRLKVRVVQFPTLSSIGMPYDRAAVMLESPNTQLYWLYRETAQRLVLFFMRQIEARIRGFLLQRIEGQVMPWSNRLANWLL